MKKGSLYKAVRIFIYSTLSGLHWNRTLAAEELGISVRCLRMKIKQYQRDGIRIPENPTNRPKGGAGVLQKEKRNPIRRAKSN